MAAGRPVGGNVRRFGGDTELTNAELREAPIHPPRPAALEAPLRHSRASARSSPRRRRRRASRTLGDLLLRFPHSHRDRTSVAVADLAPGDSGDRSRRGPRQHPAPLSPPRPLDHLGQSRRRLRLTSAPPGSTSPGSPRSSPPADPAPHGLPGQARLPGFGVRGPRLRPAGPVAGGGGRCGPSCPRPPSSCATRGRGDEAGPGSSGDRAPEGADDQAVDRAVDRAGAATWSRRCPQS